MLTGKTPARLGFEFVTKNAPGHQSVEAPLRAPAFTLDLSLEEITIAEHLHAAGYETGFVGKWHLNQHYKRYLGWSPTHGPPRQGFVKTRDTFGSHPYSYYRKKDQRGFLDLPEGEFPEDSLTDFAIEFLKQDRDAPFFLMVSHYFVHDPNHTRIRWLYEKYLEMIPVDNPRREALAHYGSMVTTLDHYIGHLLAGLEENTVVVFTSDNGGHPNYAGNRPLRGSKWNLYEGGIRVPFIVSGFDAKGVTCDVPVISLDLYPTFSEIAGEPVPSDRDGQSLLVLWRDPEHTPGTRPLYWHFPYYHPEKGFAKAAGEIGVDDGVTSQTRPHSAIREGDWKLIHFYEGDRTELYHLGNDPSENTDRSTRDAKVASELHRKLMGYLKKVHARFPVKH